MSAVATRRNGRVGTSTSAMGFSTSITRAADDSLLSFPRDQQRREAWQGKLDGPLLEIARNPGQFNEDDLSPPSPAAIDAAMQLAQLLRDDAEMDPPRTIVPSGDGGITFEWGHPGALYLALEIKEDGTAVCTLSRNCVIVFRQQIQ